jgi:predicted ATPase
VVLISGPSGIGKSALVREVHKPILEKHGFFGSGKADELRRNIPYAALSQALREVAQQILSEDDVARQRWQHDILESVGPNVRLLADLVPELSTLTGPLPPVPDVDVGEAHNRLGETLRKLIQLLANARHPLVLFLDDLQWMDFGRPEPAAGAAAGSRREPPAADRRLPRQRGGPGSPAGADHRSESPGRHSRCKSCR